MSLRNILFDMDLFRDESDRASSQKRVLWLLQALTNCNRLYLRENPGTPLLYQSGVKYKLPEQFERAEIPEAALLRAYLKKKGAPAEIMAAAEGMIEQLGGGEHFREIPRIIENNGGDCDNLAAWRAAELCELGFDAAPCIVWRRRPDGGMTYHVIVMHEDGSSEDPSLLMGMGGAERDADREHERQKLGERMGEFIAGLRKTTVLGGGITVTTPQDFSQFQYSIPFQTDEAYADWSPTRPQAFYADPRYPNLPTQGGPLFNTRMRDPDEMDYEDREDRFDGAPHGGHHGGHGGHGGRGFRGGWGGGGWWPGYYDYDYPVVVDDSDDDLDEALVRLALRRRLASP
jgi:hypothetical protein